MFPSDEDRRGSHRRTERRVGARLFGRWRGLSAVPVWPIGWSLVLYIYTSPSLGQMSGSAAPRVFVLSHPNRGTSREGEASIALSHRDEAPAPLTWWGGTNDLRTCLMIVKTTDSVDPSHELEAPQVVALAVPHVERDRTVFAWQSGEGQLQFGCPVTVDLPFCHWILLVRRVCHRSCSVSDLKSSHSVAPEVPHLDLQTSNHQVHRRGTGLPLGQAELTAEQDPLAKAQPHTDKASSSRTLGSSLKILTPAQRPEPEQDHLSPDIGYGASAVRRGAARSLAVPG
jgi:hypothetical protein